MEVLANNGIEAAQMAKRDQKQVNLRALFMGLSF
jgi:hypothetical protein